MNITRKDANSEARRHGMEIQRIAQRKIELTIESNNVK